jgi:DNA-binding NtrC family response regulator
MADHKGFHAPSETGAAGARTSERKTILLADDDLAVRRVATTILQKHGYPVVGANSGEQVISEFEAAKDLIALVILDQRMPGPGLEGILTALTAIQPRVRVLLMSGYMEPEIAPEIRANLCGFIGKPFRGGELLRAVQAALVEPAT